MVYYPDYATVVELDGQVAHPAGRRGRDRRRDNALVAAGGEVLRYGFAEVTDSPCAVAAQVATVLRNNGWSGVPAPCGPACHLNGDVAPDRGARS